jgi:regulator of cell morphogenesis and NO signaling
VRGLNVTQEAYQGLAQDLKVVFPLFAQDFIEHIFEEEDTLFLYIKSLLDATKGKTPLNPGQMWLTMERRGLAEFSSGHEQHDDEMEGIRSLTNGYEARPGMEPALHVLFYELRCFEADLITHAAVENHILFPRALRLEGYVRTQLNGIARFN